MTARVGRRAALVGGAAASANLFGCGRTLLTPFEGDAAAGAPNDAGAEPFTLEELRAEHEDTSSFPLGVQAGAMRETSVLFWTFTATREPATLEVYRELDAGGTIASVAVLPLDPGPDGYNHARISGLASGTLHHYVFRGRNGRSAIGRVRTAFATDRAEPLLLGATSCTNLYYAPFATLSLLAAEPLDLFVHLGDMSYNDGSLTQDDFRENWRKTLSEPGYRALLARTGSYFTWDDHEVTNDYDPERLRELNPDLVATAAASYFESHAVERGEQGGLWQSFRWGNTAEFFVLDCRSERLRSTAGTANATYISEAQLSWLEGGLAASSAHFKVILNSVPIARFQNPPAWAPAYDRWEGYPAQRERLLGFIAESALRNVWFVSGDFHLGLVQRVDASGRDSRLWEIAAGPGAQQPRNAADLSGPQFELISGENTYTTLLLDPAQDAVQVRFVNARGVPVYDRWLRSDPA